MAAASAATGTPPPAPSVAAPERRKHRFPPPRGASLVAWVILAVIVVVGLWLRLLHNGYGLPYVYNFDEANHFTNHAVSTFDSTLDPLYYQNPSGYTYLIVVALHLVYGVLGLHLKGGSVVHQFALDPSPIYRIARGLSAVLAMAGVVVTFLVARNRFGVRVALVAAALLTFAFLPVTYSRIAVTDVGTFLPVVVAVWAALRVLDDGRLRWYLLSGAAVGAACGFKYTAGLAILPVLLAGALRLWAGRADWRMRERGALGRLVGRIEVRHLLGAIAALVVVFAITTPYFFVHLHVALYQLKTQAQAAGGSEKLGQTQQGGLSYYISSLGWGFGYAAAPLALVGAIFEIRRNRAQAAVLLVFPVILFLYMSTQTRYFGRWLLAMYPILAILAGIGIVRIAQLLRGRLAEQGAIVALIMGLVLIQPLLADARTTQVIGRTDTRQLARDYLAGHFPRDTRVVIEPAVPINYYLVNGVGSHDRSRQFVRGFTKDMSRGAAVDAPLGADTTYAAGLRPEDIDAYRRSGYCLVVTMSLIRGRVENNGDPAQRAYYARLVRESQLLYTISPFKRGAKPVPLHFDFSYDYYPSAYYRPGAIIDVYRLNGCTQQYGRVTTRPYGPGGLDKGLSSSYVPGS